MKRLIFVVLSGLTACTAVKNDTNSLNCSKTSSILTGPEIREEQYYELPQAEQQAHMMKFLTQGLVSSAVHGAVELSALKTSGGYISVHTRKANDPLGLLRDENGQVQGEMRRCSMLAEFPKNRGEIPPPDSSSSPRFPSEASEIDAFRFPDQNDEMQMRIYTAAHCLDYSLAESVHLAVFDVNSMESTNSEDAFVTFEVEIQEIEAVKTLRKEIKAKIKQKEITTEQGIKILNAFRSASGKLESLFGTDTNTAKGKCVLNDSEGDEQYSCATYHDMVVLDVKPSSSLTAEKLAQLKQIRAHWVNSVKHEEGSSPLTLYADNWGWRSSLNDSVSNRTDFVGLRSDVNHQNHPEKCVPFAPAVIEGDEFPTLIGLYHPTPENCVEVSINSPAKLAYVRHVARERMRKFSRYNMLPAIKQLASGDSNVSLNLHQCPVAGDGICSLKNAIDLALNSALGGLGIAWVESSRETEYITAMQQIDEILNVWKVFFPPSELEDAWYAPVEPFDFLKFHSNFIFLNNTTLKKDSLISISVQDDKITWSQNFPDANSSTLHRSFAALPLRNIVGDEAIQEMFLNLGMGTYGVDDESSTANALPYEILNLNSQNDGHVLGSYLKLFVSKTSLTELFQSLLEDAEEDPWAWMLEPGQTTPPSDTVYVGDEESDYQGWMSIPTKVFLQKGDSGSIFTLDSIPAFALSTVNGEATSGGTSILALPILDEESEHNPSPSGEETNRDGGTTAASGGSVSRDSVTSTSREETTRGEVTSGTTEETTREVISGRKSGAIGCRS